MSKSFSLSSLLPEPLTFCDDGLGGDGTLYDVKTFAMLSAEEYASLERWQGEIISATKSAPNAEMLQLISQRTDEYFAILIPALPEARRAAIPFGYKAQFLKWWQVAQANEGSAPGESQAARPIRGRRSPASAASIPASGPKAS